MPLHSHHRHTRKSGFSTAEMIVVIGVMLVLIGIVGLNLVGSMRSSRARTALYQISATLRGARQAALTTNSSRRVVFKTSYSQLADTHADVFEYGIRQEFWVEKKKIAGLPWSDNYEPIEEDAQALQGGVLLIDINGRPMLPANLKDARFRNPDGSFSFKTYISFDAIGNLVLFFQEGEDELVNPPPWGGIAGNPPKNLALHFLLESTSFNLRMSETQQGQPSGVTGITPNLYFDWVHSSFLEKETELEPLLNLTELRQTSDLHAAYEIFIRSQCKTVYLLRWTGQTVVMDYGFGPPWPKQFLPLELEGTGN